MGASDIKTIIESLYDLGIIQKKKKKRKRKGKRKFPSGQSIPQSVSSTPVPQSPIFQNTSNLQNEYLRNQILSLENSTTNKPYIRELENQLENQKIFQNQTQRALLYLHNVNPIIEEVGYDDEDNIDVTNNGGSDYFFDEGVDVPPVIEEPPKSSSIFGNILSNSKRLFLSPTAKIFPKGQGFDDTELHDASPTNSERRELNAPHSDLREHYGIDENDEPIVKSTRGGEREKLLREYYNIGGDDDNILNTNRKKTITDAIKAQQKKNKAFEHLQSQYGILGGADNKFIDGNVKVYKELENEVHRLTTLKYPKGKKKK